MYWNLLIGCVYIAGQSYMLSVGGGQWVVVVAASHISSTYLYHRLYHLSEDAEKVVAKLRFFFHSNRWL